MLSSHEGQATSSVLTTGPGNFVPGCKWRCLVSCRGCVLERAVGLGFRLRVWGFKELCCKKQASIRDETPCSLMVML